MKCRDSMSVFSKSAGRSLSRAIPNDSKTTMFPRDAHAVGALSLLSLSSRIRNLSPQSQALVQEPGPGSAPYPGVHPRMKRHLTSPEPLLERTELAARLAEVRGEVYGEHGLPQLARELGVPVRSWCSYEAGASVPGEVLLAFLEKTGTNSDWLLKGRGPRYRSGHGGPETLELDQRRSSAARPDEHHAGGTEIVLSIPVPSASNPGTEIVPSHEAFSEHERWALMQEVSRLQRLLSHSSAQSNPDLEAALAALEEENGTLLRMCEELRHGSGPELAAARSEVNTLRSQLEAARSDAQYRQDENRMMRQSLDQLRKGAQGEIDTLRSEGESVRAQLRLAVDDVCKLREELDRTRETKKPDLTPDERMWAFRQHLQELHLQEIEERDANRRVWTWLTRKLRRVSPRALFRRA
jgi:hypothetical protein